MSQSFYQSQAPKNAMELLVTEEIEKQIGHYPPALTKEINQIEVATYALNCLPPLYASSKEGLYRQKQRGQKEFKNQIKAAVHQALEVIQRKPLRFATPLLSAEEINNEIQEARMALQELADLFVGKN
ncbi:MAG: late competence development ComFB family protein [Xenococcaceae cyanobacterium]